MRLRYNRVIQRFNRLPRHMRIGIEVLVCLLMFVAAERFGEPLGKALYFMTH